MKLLEWASIVVITLFGAMVGASIGAYYMVFYQLAQCP